MRATERHFWLGYVAGILSMALWLLITMAISKP